jgi:CDP-diacylglycerol--glycerol-3-phosphate 3-phosphatidyltransferase
VADPGLSEEDRARAAAPPHGRERGRSRLTLRRLSGLDRSGGPPPETRAGQPWNVWTLPNVIGLFRLALIPAFLATALTSDAGTDALPATLFAVAAWGDYADGIAARVTGQYSRFGALLDPVVDRLLVLSGVVVCWRFELLPRWLLALLVVREVAILVLARVALQHERDLQINWPGRAAVWPVMSAIFLALCGVEGVAVVLLVVGLVLAMLALALYVRDGLQPST